MSKEILSAEQIKSAEKAMSPKDANLTRARESIIQEIKTSSGLDSEVFDGMVESVKEDDRSGFHFSFQVRGRRIEASLKDNENWAIEGMWLNEEQSQRYRNKYLRALDGILKITLRQTEMAARDSLVEELLR